MSRLDTSWLADQMASVVESPVSSRTVLADGIDSERNRRYVAEVKDFLASSDSQSQKCSQSQREHAIRPK